MHKQYNQKGQEISSLAEFWKENWEKFSLDDLLRSLDRTDLWIILRRHLPNTGKILEGGCGLGHWVQFLMSYHYDVIGVEYVREVVLKAKKFDTTLPVYEGDVTNLMFPDDSFDAYLSFGVIEHFEEGPQKVLSEVKRVLKKGGKFLVSVPYFNFLKRLINLKNSLFKTKCCLSDGSSFYQYIYKKKELKRCLEEEGFKIIAIYEYAADAGLQNRFPVVGIMKEKIKEYRYEVGYKRKVFRFLRELYYAGTRCIPKSMFAHMIIAICENNK